MKVLIPLDKTFCSSVAIDSVLNGLWSADTEFEIITVIEFIPEHYSSYARYLDAYYEAEQHLRHQAEKFIESKIQLIANRFPHNRVTGNVMIGPAADTILARAEAIDANLIVLGTNSRKGLNRLMLGSVAEKVARCARCAVEIVRYKQVVQKGTQTKKVRESLEPA
jgi:nucleotide-binding universal stress UspA family protein